MLPAEAHVDGGRLTPARDLEFLGALVHELDTSVSLKKLFDSDHGSTVRHPPDGEGGYLGLTEMLWVRMH